MSAHRTCPACKGTRHVRCTAMSYGSNWLDIPHLGFTTGDTGVSLPENLGIPCGSDGPYLLVCLDCGRIINGAFPVTDEQLKHHIERYEAECRLDDEETAA